jgi:hypothetical protein
LVLLLALLLELQAPMMVMATTLARVLPLPPLY